MNALPALARRPHSEPDRNGVLLVNLGTPSAPTPAAIRRYLRQFLSDPRVVELPRAIWLPVLYGFILPFRPGRLAHAYGKVWTEQGSPLMQISVEQAAGLQQRLGQEAVVRLAMTYGEPSIDDILRKMLDEGVRRLLVLPLYPQYSATTSAAVFDQVYRALQALRWPPELRTVNSYHDLGAYIETLAASIEAEWHAKGRGQHLLISFHSIPRRCLEAGDPYFCQAHKTARLLAQRLSLSERECSVAFQSRLGKQPWLQPYTDVVIPELAQRGIRQLDVVCPGFSADCLETLEEVAIRYREDFLAAGGERFHYIPALNASAAHLDMLAALCRRHLQGWPPPADTPEVEDLSQRKSRAAALLESLDRPGLRRPPA